MSRDSKTRRDARKRKEPKRAIRRLGGTLQPHAQLETGDGNTVGGAGWRDGEWLTVLGGKVVARTPSAALTLAMLRHVVAVQEQAGAELKLTFSPVLETAATREAQAEGRSLEEYLHVLEQERLERLDPDGAPAQAAAPQTRH
ncbi:hypothetical protein [Lysobacter solisilvae (ex Woo and Kim 2020)]|uniref:Uncharacterized protein n=1 Tax=Agrilutibacter terrestris TaxID=2865112 RepID=A0A7H0FUN2_9GAMM|nr:hypothetical protein [Lysobacter terrestris]QNP39748.1 hypothetical protein H8B22_09505 [Lysobacter terrestris]